MRPSLAFAFFLLIVTLFHFFAFCSSSEQPAVLCHSDERLALMQFKESFIIDKHACAGSYPKAATWGSQGVDCCSWDGVECDQMTGAVIGLDLSGGCLYGSINSSSTLFRLIHLQRLNLAHNDFNHSLIPSALGNLSMLTYLNLSSSLFSGQIPSEISKLYRLSSLDLSYLDVASPVPSVLANLSSLTSLYLEGCELQGMFPLAIFQLPRLESIRLSEHWNLTGYLPEFNFSNQLKTLAIWHTGFSGELPASLGNLHSLEFLDLGYCYFKGSVPSSLGNLPNLKFLDLSVNFFMGSVPPTLGNLTKLNQLNLRGNHFTGFIPPELTNLTKLTHLDLQQNGLQGLVPSSIRKLHQLEYFNCDYNRLNGNLEIDTFLELKKLQNLFLSLNDFYLVSRNKSNATSAQLVDIGLRYCHLREFPYFLRNQRRLQLLDLSSNNIEGQIPQWMSKVSVETLFFLDLSNNSLTGFDEFPVVLPWSNLQYLKLDSNILQGSLPVPPLSTIFYSISNNSLTGEIPQQLCNVRSLSVLDFSQNNLSGEIPMCLSNFSKNLSVLNGRSNDLHGSIPSGWARGNRLNMIAFGRNKLQGKIPKSLMECRALEYLDLGNNRIRDVFPSWLGSLPELNILILSSNALYGSIGDPTSSSNLTVFPKLRVIDLSHNRFRGTLPSGYFKRWITMASLDAKTSSPIYMLENSEMIINTMQVSRSYPYSMIITNKGTEMKYPVIIQNLAAIDFSGNKFDGEIPESIGSLKELRLLNFSNNNLVGQIPEAIANLTNLEALDLSWNKLEGRIPSELSSQLTFLGFLNLSHNHLTGLIPQGGQFWTFESSSFEGNPGLCGKPLLKDCSNSRSGCLPTPSSTASEELGLLQGLDWIVVILVGYGCGFLFGAVVGNVVMKRKPDWFANTFSKTLGTRQRR